MTHLALGHEEVVYLTPKALANFSPGFELARTLGATQKGVLTLKGFANRRTLSGFGCDFELCPRVLVPRTLG